jgi:uncharacterized protein (TIGR02285 family)
MNRNATLKPRRHFPALWKLIFLLTLATPTFAQDKPVVVWYVLDFPPINIVQGPDKGRGNRDAAMQQVIQHTPEFTHRITTSNGPRALDALKNTPNACQPALMYTAERAKFTEYSISSDWALPNGVIILPERIADFAPFLNTAGELELEKLLTESTLRFGINVGRSYGEEIDVILARHPERLVDVASSNLFSSNLLKLVSQSGFDATLGFPTELYYLIRTNAVPATFKFLPIAEARSMILGEIGCSKTEQGRQFITAFDRVLARPEVQTAIDAAALEWVPPDLRDYYRRRKAEQK